ncbi:DMT family transporter [Patescibacteria group bacterium]|nr:DMT family transporter [Patescibacteria group bacterium]MBU1910789.1 DMT family transporter [Patescibacteria group bacterium]
MNQYWFFFALISPFLWAFTNILDSSIRRRYIRNDYFMMWTSAILRLPIFLLLLLIYGFEFPGWGVGIGMILAGVLWTAMFVPYLRALEFEEPSRVALFLQMISIFSLILAFIILGESLTVKQSIAFSVIFVGGLLAAIKYLENVWHFSRAFWLILIASLFWSVSDVLFKLFSYGFSSFINAFSWFLFGSISAGFFVLLVPNLRKNILTFKVNTVPIRGWTMQCISVLIGVIGSITFAYALTLGKVALTSVLVQTQPLFVLILTLILSRIFTDIDKEDISPTALLFKVLSFVIIMIGLILLNY